MVKIDNHVPADLPPDARSETTRAPASPHDGAGRRTALQCMLWAGAGVVWTMSGGVPVSTMLGISTAVAASKSEYDRRDGGTSPTARFRDFERAAPPATSTFSFAQISDSHIGFSHDPNLNPASTLQNAIGKIRAAPIPPAFIVHTGDISHLSKPSEFDTATQIINEARLDVHYVPGEHDVLIDNGNAYFKQFAPASKGPWYSFDQNGVHFIGLTNVLEAKGNGLGFLGDPQLVWLEKDLQGRSSSQPIVVFAHIPLWSVYPAWGWGTEDGARALTMMKRFGSVTVLNGHIHQVLQKVEGDMRFYTALSTAFPLPAPGMAAGPAPMKVAEKQLRNMLGLRRVLFVPTQSELAVTDSTLGA